MMKMNFAVVTSALEESKVDHYKRSVRVYAYHLVLNGTGVLLFNEREGCMLSSQPCLFPHKFSIWPPCGTVLTGGMCDYLTAMWYRVDRWNVRLSDRHMVPCWPVEFTMIWPPCGTVLTGGMYDYLTAMWYCVDWWNARWSDRHVVPCWLVECTVIWVWFQC